MKMVGIRRGNSSVSVVTRIRLDDKAFDLRRGQTVLFGKSSRPALEPYQELFLRE